MTHNRERELSGRTRKVTEHKRLKTKRITFLPVSLHWRFHQWITCVSLKSFWVRTVTCGLFTHQQDTTRMDNISRRSGDCCGGVVLTTTTFWLLQYYCGSRQHHNWLNIEGLAAGWRWLKQEIISLLACESESISVHLKHLLVPDGWFETVSFLQHFNQCLHV